jgi:hypothetical protein
LELKNVNPNGDNVVAKKYNKIQLFIFEIFEN